MGAVSDSIRKAAEAFGCEVRTNAKVDKILVRGGRAVGVVLEDGASSARRSSSRRSIRRSRSSI
jgi:phytoene dehydrogenase-like protein